MEKFVLYYYYTIVEVVIHNANKKKRSRIETLTRFEDDIKANSENMIYNEMNEKIQKI